MSSSVTSVDALASLSLCEKALRASVHGACMKDEPSVLILKRGENFRTNEIFLVIFLYMYVRR